MNILNEVHFLADIETTPTFLIFDNKKQAFSQVSIEESEEDDEGSEEESAEDRLVRTLVKRITKTI